MINEPRSGPELKIRDLYKPPEKPPFSYFFKCLTEGTEKNTIFIVVSGKFQRWTKFPTKNWSDFWKYLVKLNSNLVRFLEIPGQTWSDFCKYLVKLNSNIFSNSDQTSKSTITLPPYMHTFPPLKGEMYACR
jgi:hypothetical protein